MNKPIAWSYSSLTSFETCPRRHYLTKIAKTVVEPPSEALNWGRRVHKGLEDYVKEGKPLSADVKQFQPIADKLLEQAKGGTIDAEQKLTLTKDLLPTEWFNKQAWVRGIVDVTIEKNSKVFVGDYKTGKPDHDSAQLRLTAAMILATRPWIKEVINSFIWLKTGGTTAERVTRAEIPAIWDSFNARVRRLETAIEQDKFPPRPSGLCGAWCPCVSCEHNGKYTGRRSL